MTNSGACARGLRALVRADWTRVSACTWIGLAIFVVFFSPFLVEATAVGLALAALIPLALVLGLIEHCVPPLWLLVVVFIQVAGLADLVADSTLLVKILIVYVTGDPNEGVDEDTIETEDERQLFIARALITLIGALPVILFFAFGMSPVTRLLRDLGLDTSAPSKDDSTRLGNGAVALVLLALAWKVVMVCLRALVLFRVTRDIITTGRIRRESRDLNEFLEMFLLLDLLWSGIPLGVLTFLELFFFGEGFGWRTTQVFELIKLSAVAVDSVAAAYIIYFTIFDVGHLCHLDKLHAEEHEELPITKPTTTATTATKAMASTTASTATKAKAKAKICHPAKTNVKGERQPLVINSESTGV